MTDKMITELLEDTTPLETDLVVTVDDPSGTPINKKVTVANLTRFCVAKALFDAYTILMATTDDTPVALTVPEQTIIGRITGGIIAALSASQIRTLLNVADGATANLGDVVGPVGVTTLHAAQFNGATGKLLQDGGVLGTMAAAAATDYVAKALFDAYSILAATTDDTPAALTVAEQTLLGRITGGAIAALSIAQIRTLLGITAAGAELINDADAATQRATLGAIATGDSRLSDARVALDVYAWAKAANPPAIGPFISEIDRSDGNDYSLAARTQGIYAIAGAGSNGPGPTYLNLIHAANHSDVAFQIAGGYVSDAMYFRGTSALQNGTGYTPWRTVLHDGNIGSYAVVGPASATDNAIVRFDAATGKLVQDSSAIIDDNGEAIIKGFPVTLFLAALARHGTLTNLITNGNFETDIIGWTGAGATISRDTATPLVGVGSLKSVAVGAGADNSLVYLPSSATIGHIYLLQALIKSTAAAGRKMRVKIGEAVWHYGPDVDCSAAATLVTFAYTLTITTPAFGFELNGAVDGESFLLDSVVCYDLTA